MNETAAPLSIFQLNSSSSTTKSTSYGTLYITKYGKIVELSGTFSSLPTSAWTVFVRDLPLPKSGTQHQFINSSADGANQVTVNLTSTGALQYYGRGTISAFILEVTYISE